MFDVSSLLEDSEMKITALERVELLEEQLLDVRILFYFTKHTVILKRFLVVQNLKS